MPHSNRPPSYRLHKARQSAVVTINGQNRYLGPYGVVGGQGKLQEACLETPLEA
jgi:hypothetical protein